MTREETKRILSHIIAAYPNYHPADIKMTVDKWTEMLADYEHHVVFKALQKFILSDTSGFAPSIGQIVGMIDAPVSREPLEAWDLVRKAIRNGYYFAEQEFNKLPIECQKAIGSPANLKEMALMPTETVESVEQSHFIRSYQSVVKRLDDEKRLPQNFKSYTEQIAEKMKEHKAIEKKEVIKEEPSKIEIKEGSMVEMVKARMEKKKNDRL